MPSKALVWFKRDLRVRDHAPLIAALGHREAQALFIVEPAWLSSPECDSQHVDFALACLDELRGALAALGLALHVAVGEAVAVLAAQRALHGFTHLLSHEETGPGWTYTRDLAVGGWCREHDVVWQEWPQNGVVRRLKTRSGWAGRWASRMGTPELMLSGGLRVVNGDRSVALAGADFPPSQSAVTLASLGLPAHGKLLQPAGEAAAWNTLASFLQGRGRGYRRALSSPLTAEEGCSRLSPHLAFGTVSVRCVHQATEAAIAQARDVADDASLAYALRGFAGRLRWHCHFMQKLEDEPAIEFRNFARACDGLRPGDIAGGAGESLPPDAALGDGATLRAPDRERFIAWCEGRTGFPMVDACMRSLRATGWLNFRMRAMLVSFASYHLWLHWREPGLFLARQFLDFEPGIHWSQMQMQSGTTGINTLRIYSPAKQALDHDPQGVFVRRWVPEFGTPAYPAPIVDERAALKHARDRLYGLRATPEARAEASAVQHKHGSRKSGLPPSGRGTGAPKRVAKRRAEQGPSTQIELFSE